MSTVQVQPRSKYKTHKTQVVYDNLITNIMATMKEDRTTAEEEELVKKELDPAEISQLCKAHSCGVSATDGVEHRKATAECRDLEDGSGGKNEKCSQQADHYRSTIRKTN